MGNLYNVLYQMIPRRGQGFRRLSDLNNPTDWGDYILFPGSNVLICWKTGDAINFQPNDLEDKTVRIIFDHNFATSPTNKVTLSATTSTSIGADPDLFVSLSIIHKDINSVTVKAHRISGTGSCFITAIAIGVASTDPTVVTS